MINNLVERYRKLKAKSDALDREMKEIKVKIEPLVEAVEGRKWMDRDGYARIVQRNPSISYDVKALDALISSVPEAKVMLEPHRRERPGARYLQVK